MNKAVILVLAVFFSFCYAPKEHEIEKFMEDGVEVVLNHIEPYKIKGGPTTFNLEKEFLIDLEREDLAEKGDAFASPFDCYIDNTKLLNLLRNFIIIKIFLK